MMKVLLQFSFVKQLKTLYTEIYYHNLCHNKKKYLDFYHKIKVTGQLGMTFIQKI